MTANFHKFVVRNNQLLRNLADRSLATVHQYFRIPEQSINFFWTFLLLFLNERLSFIEIFWKLTIFKTLSKTAELSMKFQRILFLHIKSFQENCIHRFPYEILMKTSPSEIFPSLKNTKLLFLFKTVKLQQLVTV